MVRRRPTDRDTQRSRPRTRSSSAAAQTDPVVFPTPDTTWSPKGPNWIQIGSEGGFLPAPVVVPAQPTTWITDPTRFDVGNVDLHSLLLAPAERADVIVDFSQFRGKTLILYNDAPAAFPARVPRLRLLHRRPRHVARRRPTTLPGYGPNTRTIMQVKVSTAAPAIAFDRPNTSIDRMGALVTAFDHTGRWFRRVRVLTGPDHRRPGRIQLRLRFEFRGQRLVQQPNRPPAAKCDGFARIMEQGTAPEAGTDEFKFKFDTLGPQRTEQARSWQSRWSPRACTTR